MTARRVAVWAGGVAIVAVVLAWALLAGWSRRVAVRQEESARLQVSRLLQEGKGREAAEIIRAQPLPLHHPDWLGLQFRAAVLTRNVATLHQIYLHQPDLILRDEEASLLMLRAWLAERRDPLYETVRDSWRGREHSPARWTLLDADALLRRGKPQEAMARLRDPALTGQEESGRLIRLALLAAPSDLPAAWNYLVQARDRDARNPDVRLFCGQFLEAAGKTGEARVEYVAAALADPVNPLLRDQLAEFYHRQGSLDLSIQTWRDALEIATAPGYLWVKTLFWSMVVQPASNPLPVGGPRDGFLSVVTRLHATPPDAFLPPATGQALPLRGVRGRPELYWLSLLECLRTGDEGQAMSLADEAPAAVREFQPDLLSAVRVLLHVRAGATNLLANPSRDGFATTQPFLASLAASVNPPSPEWLAFVRGPHAWAAACFAVGWRGAGLRLAGAAPLVASDPDWYAYAVVQATRYNRGADAALALMKDRQACPLTDLLTAELLLAKNQAREAVPRLESLMARSDDIGERAAWILAVVRLEEGNARAVRALLKMRPDWARSVTGREIEARLALLEGQDAGAEAIYKSLVGESLEARAWLAKRAVLRKDWREADSLTRELVRMMPEEIDLRRSLAVIESHLVTP